MSSRSARVGNYRKHGVLMEQVADFLLEVDKNNLFCVDDISISGPRPDRCSVGSIVNKFYKSDNRLHWFLHNMFFQFDSLLC